MACFKLMSSHALHQLGRNGEKGKILSYALGALYF